MNTSDSMSHPTSLNCAIMEQTSVSGPPAMYQDHKVVEGMSSRP